MLLCLLALGAVWYLWPRAGRPAAAHPPAAPIVATVSSSAPAVSATNAPIAEDSGSRSAASTNRLTFRLANTPKSITQLTGDRHAILLENAFIDTTATLDLKIPTHLRAEAEPGAYIVQARGVIDGAFRNVITDAGGTIVSYIPNNAFLVQVTAAGASALAANARVQAVLPYEPYYKVQASLLDLAINQKPLPPGTYLTLGLFGTGADATIAQLEKLGVEILGRDRSPFGPIVRVRAPADWIALAKLAGVQILEPVYRRKLANDLSRVAVGVSTNTTDGATNNYLGLTGKNITVEVNDTGVDAGHPDFSVGGSAGSPGSTPPTRVFFDVPGSTNDTDGHGTHVAGIIAGNGSMSRTPFNVGAHARGSVTNADFRGKAPDAAILSVGGIGGGHDFNTSDSFMQEAAVRLTNALISNNSWTYGDNSYDLAAASYDAAVRDAVPEATGPQPVLFVFAAGNDGGGNDNGSSGNADSIGSPGTAKNVITVGALEELRNITNIVTGLNGSSNAIWAAETDSGFQVPGYSSRGNVGVQTEGAYGRFKPDVVAPGTFTVSLRSQQWDELAYYNPTNYHVNIASDFVTSNAMAFGFVTVPQNAVGISIQVVANASSPTPFPTQFPIYLSSTGVPNPADTTSYDIFKGNTNFLAVPPDSGGAVSTIANLRNIGFIYAVGDPTNRTAPMSFDVIETVITTNDLGNELIILSNLNNFISGGPASYPHDSSNPHYYRYESGTSMATPAVSGVLALMQDFFVNKKNPNFTTNPSPALLKAMVINGARLTGNYKFAVTNTLNFEGWGQVQLPNSLPAALAATNATATNAPFFFVDQDPTNALATGDRRTFNVTLPTAAARAQSLRITLAWTDPPGNPAAAIKLVNDLDLVVTNNDDPTNPVVYYGNNFGSFGSPPYSSPSGTNSIGDNINNVENVYLPATQGSNYTVTVIGHAVNVNAVTLNQTNIVQDFALVISSGNGNNTNGIVVTPVPPALSTPVVPRVDYLASTNGIYFNQYAGANAPWISTNDQQFGAGNSYGFDPGAVFHIGQTNQWHFYVVTNTTGFTNAAFIIFLPNTAAIPREGVNQSTDANSTRPEADLEMLVTSPTTEPSAVTITNLNGVIVSNCLFNVNGDAAAIGRGGSEFIAYSNSTLNQVYYIGVQCQDQMAGEYAFVPIFSEQPFSTTDQNGNAYIHGVNVPVNIPDGNNRHPGVGYVIGLCVQPLDIKRVIVTNTFTHQNFGDLVGGLSHLGTGVTLNNHDGLGAVTPAQQFIYDDSGQGDVPGAIHSDGPGALPNFRGQQGAGLWLLTEVDDSFSQTGAVTSFTMKIEPHRNLKYPAFLTVTIPPGGWFYDYIDVPVGYTNMLVVATNLPPTSQPPIQLYVKEGDLPTLADTNDVAWLTNCPVGTYPTGLDPGNEISVGPPLVPDRYFVGLYNPDTVSHDVLIGAILSFNQSAISTFNFNGSGPLEILDDAVTTDSIQVSDPNLIQDFNVGLRIDHPRISDLVITLIGPDGTRYLLMENRGGQSTNGCGTTVIVTNTFAATASGGREGATNFYDLQETAGTVPITWQFYQVPDQMDVYYQGTLIFSTGLVSGGGSTNISFGPGASTQIEVVMDATNHPSATLWNYTVGGVLTNYDYLTFTEDTNLTTTPIKFAPPPFVPQVTSTPLLTNNFDADVVQTYTNGQTFDGWTVLTNQVDVGTGTNPPAFSAPNYLALDHGVIVTNLTTVPGREYNLSYQRGNNVSDNGDVVTNADWRAQNFRFTAVATNTPLVLASAPDVLAGLALTNAQSISFDTNTLLDDLVLRELPGNLYYQPEQSLVPLNDTPANGTGVAGDIGIWTLEILDNRAGATNFTPTLVSWNLGFTYANTNYTIPLGSLDNGLIETNFAPPHSLAWFAIKVPTNAIAQTNSLLFATLPLNIWFSTTNPPTTNGPLSTLELGSSVGGSTVVYHTSTPPMVPGTTNYLGVQNPNSFGATYAIEVTFEFTNVPVPPYGTTNVLAYANSLPATGVTGTNAQLNGFATPNLTNGSPATARFQWGATTAYGNVTPPVNVGIGFNEVYVNAAISNLYFAEVYHCRIVVSNSVGVTYGADEQFAPGNVVAWGDNTALQTNVPAGVSNIVAVAGGVFYSLALKDDHTVVAWGYDGLADVHVPANLTNVVAIAGSTTNSLVLNGDGTILEWNNLTGLTGSPAGVTNVVYIAGGGVDSVALKQDGTVSAWDNITYEPATVPAGLSNVVAVAAGEQDLMALLNNGSVVVWGDNTFGQTNVPGSVSNIVMVAGGSFHNLVLQNGGAVLAWGDNTFGETTIPTNLNTVVAIAAGLGDNLVLQNDSTVVAWGNNSSAQTNVPPGLGPVFAVACGARHDLVLTAEPPLLPPYASTLPATAVTATRAQLNGFATPNTTNGTQVTAWFRWGTSTNYAFQTPPVDVGNGFNVVLVTNRVRGLRQGQTCHFQLVVSNYVGVTYGFDQWLVAGGVKAWGDNSSGEATIPDGLTNVVSVAAGGAHNLVILTNGQVEAWGNNGSGQINVPAGLTNTVAVVVAGGFSHSLALQRNGVVTAWGDNTYSQSTVPASATNMVRVAGGGFASLALRNNGLISAWGDNTFGQTNVPAGLGNSNVVAVAEGAEHSLALLNDGTVVGWGTNVYGQISVPAMNHVVAVAAGGYHSLALLNSGAVVAWGLNNAGQATVPSVCTNNVVAIAAGGFHSLALLNDGSVVAWGDDKLGQTNVPGDVSNVVAVAAGTYHNVVLTSPFPVNLNLIPFPTNGLPVTNIVGPGGINWFEIDVPTNAIAATNTLLFATLPVNLWWSTNFPPSITAPNDAELLTNQSSGTAILYHDTPPPTMVAGGIYYLGVQNTNSVAVTNAIEVTFELAVPPVLPPVEFVQFVQGGDTLIVTNTAFDIYPADVLDYNLTTNVFLVFPFGPIDTNGAVNPVIDTNGIITWTVPTNTAVTVSLFHTTVTDTNTGLGDANDFLVIAFPNFAINVPVTNGVPPNSIGWYPVRVPFNAIAATNALLAASAPVNLWYSTNLPPSITNSADVELLTNLVNGTNVIDISNTVPLLQPGGLYFLGVENNNPFAITNVLQVTFRYRLVPPVLPVIPDQSVAGGFTLTVTNTATDTNAGAVLAYALVNPPPGVVIDPNGIITWLVPTNIAPTNVVITTIATDANAGLSATNSFNVFVLPGLTDGMPVTNIVAPGGINWFQVKVPSNALAATNSLLFATLPLNLWYSTNLPPTLTNSYDFELLTNSLAGDHVLDFTTLPRLVPGSTYYLGVQNTNAVAVTNAVEVTFLLTNTANFSIFSIVHTNITGTNGFLLTWFAPAGTQFHLRWTPELDPVTWTNFKGVISFTSFIAATNSEFQYFDDGSQTGGFGPHRFYRLQLLNSPTNTEPEFILGSGTYTATPTVLFSVTNNARDWDIPAQKLVYTITNSVPGPNVATIDTNGVITWTPDFTQAGVTNFIVTTVTDNGVPAKNATNLLIVIVSGTFGAIAPSYLVSHWPLNESNGVVAHDVGPAHNDGLVTNVGTGTYAWTGGVEGSALAFTAPGVSLNETNGGFVSMGNPASLDFESTNAFTISAWIKMPPGSGQNSTIVGKMHEYTATENNFGGYELHYGTGHQLTVWIVASNGAGGASIQVDSNIPVNDGNWHQVAFTYNGNGLESSILIYVDGRLDTAPITGGAFSGTLGTNSIHTAASFDIGSRSDGLLHNFIGSIDDVQVYNTVLSSNSMLALFKNPGLAIGPKVLPANFKASSAPGGYALNWIAPPYEVFQAQWCTNLTPPVTWTLFPNLITSTNGAFSFTDTNSPFLMKFYQLILLP